MPPDYAKSVWFKKCPISLIDNSTVLFSMESSLLFYYSGEL